LGGFRPFEANTGKKDVKGMVTEKREGICLSNLVTGKLSPGVKPGGFRVQSFGKKGEGRTSPGSKPRVGLLGWQRVKPI